MWCGPHRGQARENPQISAPPTPAWSILPPVLERQLGVLGAAPPRRWCRGHCVSVPLLSFWATGSVITLYHFLGNGFLSLSETLPILFWALFFCHLPIPQSPTPPTPSAVHHRERLARRPGQGPLWSFPTSAAPAGFQSHSRKAPAASTGGHTCPGSSELPSAPGERQL